MEGVDKKIKKDYFSEKIFSPSFVKQFSSNFKASLLLSNILFFFNAQTFLSLKK